MRPQSFRSPLPRAVGKLHSRPVAGEGAVLRRGLLHWRVKNTRQHPKHRGRRGAEEGEGQLVSQRRDEQQS